MPERLTRRPVSEGAEEILGLYFPVLDHGFVSLVDYMGTDECVERAARVSYGYGTRKRSLTRGLLRYLRRHLHTTPSEMVELKFHCCMPMFVARQWIRHRTACLSGDARLFFDLPGAETRGRRQRHQMTIAEFHRLWHEGAKLPMTKKKPAYLERIDLDRRYTIPELAKLVDRREETLRSYVRDGLLGAERVEVSDPREPAIFVRGSDWREFATKQHVVTVDLKSRLAKMKLRSCDESTGEIIHTNVVDIWESGVKPVFRVTLANGRTLKMSKDHRCLTEQGWLSLEAATGLRLGAQGGVTWEESAPAFAVNGIPAYQDEAWLKARRQEGLDITQIAARAGTSYHTIRKYLKKFSLTFTSAKKSRLSGLAQRGTRRTFAKPRKMTPLRAREFENLLTLCSRCHDRVHADNLELELLSAVETGQRLENFWVGKERQPRPQSKPRGRTTRLVRSYSKVVKIELVGEEMTYDLEVSGPYHNFVAEGFIVHNSVNEYSGRYSLMPMLFYTPSAEQLQTQSLTNNQGRSGETVQAGHYQEAVRRWNEIRERAQSAYEWMTSEEIARELARIDLPLSTYTQWYWKVDLHNLLHFLKLRVDRHAQWEIQEFGRIMAGMLKRVAPLSYEAWIDYDVCGAHMSRMELDVLRRFLTAESGTLSAESGVSLGSTELEGLGLARREVTELFEKLESRPVPDFELDLSQAVPAETFAERIAAAVPKVDKPPTE